MCFLLFSPHSSTILTMRLTSTTFPVFHSGILSIATPSILYNTLKYHVYTIFLFTISDIKTVLLPVVRYSFPHEYRYV